MHEDVSLCSEGCSRWKDGDLMQFTGLKDKNGKEIYEGDILRVDKYNHVLKKQVNSEVFWMESHGMFQHTWDEGSHFNDTKEFWNNEPLYKVAFSMIDVSPKCEVIGNIYENPELLNHD